MLRLQFVKLALFFAPLLLKNADTSVMAAPSSANAVPFSAIGDVAAVQTTSGGFRMYSQNSDGDIVQTCVHGPFTIGSTSDSACGKNFENFVVVPANETMYGTPIAVTGLQDTNGGPVHVYFYSPDRVISEYIQGSGWFDWQSGSSCTQCITNEGFVAAEGTNTLYALGSTNASLALRVGFFSAGAPQTMTEAVYDSSTGRWASAGIPN